MSRVRSGTARWGEPHAAGTGGLPVKDVILYVKLMAKVAFYSLGMLLFFSAINILPVLLRNIFTSRPILFELLEPSIVSLKLWGLFFGIMAIISSYIYWSAPKKAEKTPE
ncbi:hypothetical protein [Brevundimonas sp.]|uniref:hypothetical protein n=1 Tax=Brevundimonas sp. TaxID=1871086 RepID=UPI00391B29D3